MNLLGFYGVFKEKLLNFNHQIMPINDFKHNTIPPYFI